MAPENVSEIDIMKIIDDALQKTSDIPTRTRILTWAVSKFSEKPIAEIQEQVAPPKQKKPKSKNSSKSKRIIPIDKTLDLNPSGKKSFKDFGREKSPSDFYEKCTTAVYYLGNILEMPNINPSQVLACFMFIGWEIPSDIYQKLASTASVKGWLDTKEMTNIKITPHGIYHIEHDLPRKDKIQK